jgi:hypothetical protein
LSRRAWSTACSNRRASPILSALTARRTEKADAANNRILELQRIVNDAEDKLKRLYMLGEDGVAEIDEVLKDRLNSLKAERDTTKAALERAKASVIVPASIRATADEEQVQCP